MLGAGAPGELMLLAEDDGSAVASTISYAAGRARANNGILPLDASGLLGFSCEQSAGGVDLLIDVSGYFQ